VLRRPPQPPPPSIPEVLREADQPTERLPAVGTAPPAAAPEESTEELPRVRTDDGDDPEGVIDLSIVPGFGADDDDDDDDEEDGHEEDGDEEDGDETEGR
jgi:hypothetical protein